MNNVISLFVVRRDDGLFFGGFNREIQAPRWVDKIDFAKMFSSCFDAKLRPDETLVELRVGLNSENTTIGQPFIPRKRSTEYVMDTNPVRDYSHIPPKDESLVREIIVK